MQKPSASACIVTYNGADEALAAAKSVINSTIDTKLDMYIVDNSSPDGTGKILAQSEIKDSATIICLEDNIGFGSGHNKVLPLICSDYHFIINPDITLKEDSITKICDYMEKHKDVVMVTPRLLFPDGREQFTAKRRPSFMALLARQLPFSAFKNIEKHYLMQDEDLTKEQIIDFCSGCFMAVRTKAFKEIGGFDEKYFMYVEDADLTRKVQSQGKCVYLPIVSVIHAWHREPNKKLREFFRQINSMFRYWIKWGFKFI